MERAQVRMVGTDAIPDRPRSSGIRQDLACPRHGGKRWCPLRASKLCRVAMRRHLGDILTAMRRSLAEAIDKKLAILFIDEVDAAGNRYDTDAHGC